MSKGTKRAKAQKVIITDVCDPEVWYAESLGMVFNVWEDENQPLVYLAAITFEFGVLLILRDDVIVTEYA